MLIIIRKNRLLKILFFVIMVFSLIAFIRLKTSFARAEVEKYKGHPLVVWEVSTEQKVIALTFDDGPSPLYTEQVLDILKNDKIKATFFIVGKRAEILPQIVKRIYLEGHEIANHTYNHPINNTISQNRLIKEIELADKLIIELTGQRSKYFRPPGGIINDNVLEVCKQLGYKITMWNWDLDSKDWSNPGTQKIINTVSQNAKNGGIVILHDCGGNRDQTIEALPAIIEKLKQDGYRFVTISELDNQNI